MPRVKQEVYTSSTKGEIALSFTGRHILQKLREAAVEAIEAQDYDLNGQALSRVRGELAAYISKLESQVK